MLRGEVPIAQQLPGRSERTVVKIRGPPDELRGQLRSVGNADPLVDAMQNQKRLVSKLLRSNEQPASFVFRMRNRRGTARLRLLYESGFEEPVR
jgi:hypothetical protein